MRSAGAVVAASAVSAVTLVLYFWVASGLATNTLQLWELGGVAALAAWLALLSMPIVAGVGLPIWYVMRHRNMHTSIRACLLLGGSVAAIVLMVMVLSGTFDPSDSSQPRPTSTERMRRMPVDLFAVAFVTGSTASLAFWWIQPFGTPRR